MPTITVVLENETELAVARPASFFEQFAVELQGIDEKTCNGNCTWDSQSDNNSVTDYEST